MPPDLHIDPDAVDGVARLARRIVTELEAGMPVEVPEALTAPVHRAAAELVAFAVAAEGAARRIRDADRAAEAGFHDRCHR